MIINDISTNIIFLFRAYFTFWKYRPFPAHEIGSKLRVILSLKNVYHFYNLLFDDVFFFRLMTYATAKDSNRSFYLLLKNKLFQEFNIHMHFVKVVQISSYFFNVNLHKNCICAFFFMHVIIKGMMDSSCLP